MHVLVTIIGLLLDPFLFESFGAIEELVILWKAFDALVFVWTGIQVAWTLIIPIKAHIRFLFLLFRGWSLDIIVWWAFSPFARALWFRV